uniref:NADH-ubiquinone oxidoreductase MWFE subunit n=1 Tax=Trichuris muris TaxID=70415 RepID=A0A5S6QTQ7_TRIMR
MLAKFKNAVLRNGKWLWTNYPEIAIPGVAAVISLAVPMYFFVYKQWYKRGTVSYYKSRYTVWRPDDPHLKDNYDLFNGEKEY